MTINVQAMLTSLFLMLAYVAPISLAFKHGYDDKRLNEDLHEESSAHFGPAFYAAVIAALALIAMNARVSAFLEAHITTSVGSLAPATLVALFTAAAASLGVAMFGWIIPSISGHSISLLRMFKGDGVNHQQSAKYALDDFGQSSGVHRGFQVLLAAIGHVVAISCGLLALAAYLLWPALPLAMDSEKNLLDRVAEQKREQTSKVVQSELRSATIDAAARANQLVFSLSARRADCANSGCQIAATRRLKYVSTSLSGWRILPSDGFFLVDEFVDKVHDLETVNAIQARLDELARQHRVVLSSPARSPKRAFGLDGAVAEQGERLRVDQHLDATGRQLAAAVRDPVRAMSLIASDITMALAIGLELAAIALTFAASLSRHSSR